MKREPVSTALPPEAIADGVGTDAVGPSLLDPALAWLRGRLREPAGTIRRRWCASGAPGRERLDRNLLFPLAVVWSAREPAVAAELVLGALGGQAADGALPRFADPLGREEGGVAPWPLLAQAAQRAWTAGGDHAFLRGALPGLDRYLSWALAYFDPDRTGRPVWRTDAEAFIPDIWDQDLATVDLAAFLLGEIDAVLALAAELQDAPVHGPTLEARRRLFREQLQGFYWNEREGRFQDRYRDGTAVSRRTLSAVLPLLWPGLAAGLRDRTIAGLEEADPLLGPAGMRLWEAWPDDPEPPPVPWRHQLIALEAFRVGRWENGCRRLQRALRSAIEPRLAASAEWPGVSQPEEDAATAEGSDPLAEALAGASAELTNAPPGGRGRHALLAWLDVRTRSIAVAAAVLLLVFLAAIAAFHASRRSVPSSSVEALAGLARNHYQKGEYEEAIRIYRELLRGGSAPALHLLYGNALFRVGRYGEAEEQYRIAVGGSAPGSNPIALYNLAQALYREGHAAEAADLLNQFIEKYSIDYPEVTARSRLALTLMHPAAPGTPPSGTP